MNVLLTFDVEVWCRSWTTLDEDFPASFERYVFGTSDRGQYALPKTLKILDRYDLKAVFFVEPLFAAKFGIEYLAKIVRLIQDAGHEIQLHLHPEWTDEACQPLLPKNTGKRQHLTQYSLREQHLLIAHGIRMLHEAGGDSPPIAFRSGSFACNEDTFAAVAANGLRYDSSINREINESRPGKILIDSAGYCEPFTISELTLVPMTSFRDGFGHSRHAQVGACSANEIIEALCSAERDAWPVFVILSHNFELMVPEKNSPDWIIVRRFERICRYLSQNRDIMSTVGFRDLPPLPEPRGLSLPKVGKAATSLRYLEQGLRRLQ